MPNLGRKIETLHWIILPFEVYHVVIFKRDNHEPHFSLNSIDKEAQQAQQRDRGRHHKEEIKRGPKEGYQLGI